MIEKLAEVCLSLMLIMGILMVPFSLAFMYQIMSDLYDFDPLWFVDLFKRWWKK